MPRCHVCVVKCTNRWWLFVVLTSRICLTEYLRASKYFYAKINSGAPARRRRSSRAPFLRKFGKPIKPRKYGYDVTLRASERPAALTDSGGGVGGSRCNPNYSLLINFWHPVPVVRIPSGEKKNTSLNYYQIIIGRLHKGMDH